MMTPASDDHEVPRAKRLKTNAGRSITVSAHAQTGFASTHAGQEAVRPNSSFNQAFDSFICTTEQLAVVHELETKIGIQFLDPSCCVRALDLKNQPHTRVTPARVKY